MRSAFLRSCAFAVAVLASAPAAAQPFSDSLVQSPEIARPQRGSLAGPLGREAFGPGELGSGAYSIPLPIEVPGERGALEAHPLPSYSPENGLGEWGLGWHADLAIRRFRVAGHVDYKTDERIGPWGRMQRGSDGAWYPVGLKTGVRVVENGGSLIALLANGSRFTFGTTTRQTTAEGTYSWLLDSVEDVNGLRVKLEYVADKNWQYLRRVSYGGVGLAFQNRIEFAYEPIPHPYVTMRSGEASTLSQRVKGVQVLALDTTTHQFVPRWSYSLGYRDDDSGVAFYLTTLQRTFERGGKDPVVRFDYRWPSDVLGSTQFFSLPDVDQALSSLTPETIQPNRSAQLDLDEDGLVDLEVAKDASLLRHTRGGFKLEAPPPRPANADPRCRPSEDTNNWPRILVQRVPNAESQVVSLAPSADGLSTELRVCGRDGARVSAQQLDGIWEPNATTRIVDITGDLTPDLVRLESGSVSVRLGAPTGASLTFGEVTRSKLSPEVPTTALWVHDFNGDGIGDLIGRTRSGLVVWLGRGRGRFVSEGRFVAFHSAAGPLSDISDFQITFVDVNRDGMTDAVLTRAQSALLYVNDGTKLTGRSVPAFATIDWQTGAPIVADLSGGGEIELSALKEKRVMALDLTNAATALLERADDGRGVVKSFQYGRAEATPGLRGRPIVLTGLTLKVAGEARLDYTYAYSRPKVDPATGLLLGFEHVERVSRHRTEAIDFLHTPLVSGLVVKTRSFDDRDPGVETVSTTDFEQTLFRGVPFSRKHLEKNEWREHKGTRTLAGEQTTYVTYDGVCPTLTERRSGTDTLTTTTTLTQPSGLAGHLTCMDRLRTLRGRHTRTELDFEYTASTLRDAKGRITQLGAVDGPRTLTLQKVAYDTAGLITTIDTPDRGRARYFWDANTRQLRESNAPDGSITRVTKRDARTSAVMGLLHDLGDARLLEQFTYDSSERLSTSWDDAGTSSALAPDSRYDYVFSTNTTPGRTTERRLVDAQGSAYHEDVSLTTAGGAALGIVTKRASSWVLSPLTRKTAEGTTETRLHAPLAANRGPSDLGFDSLDAETELVSQSVASAGNTLQSIERYHADSSRIETTRREFSGGALRQVVRLGAAVRATVTLGSNGKPAEREEPDGTKTQFTWDALGRLRAIDLPNGKRAALSFDAFGRPSAVSWQGWLSIQQAYRDGSLLVSKKKYVALDGTVLRQVEFQYDAAGRTVGETHTEPGATPKTFTFAYDVAPAECGWKATQRGRLMSEAGPGYRSCFRYDGAGRVVAQTDSLDKLRTLSTESSYYDDGSTRHELRRLLGPSGEELSRLELERVVDAQGHPAELRVVGGDVVKLEVDSHGRPSAARSASNVARIERDAATGLIRGISGERGGVSARYTAHLQSTGDPDTEQYEVAGSKVFLQHAVNARGFLESSKGLVDQSFRYDASGMLRTVTEGGKTTVVALPPVDKLGRVTKRGSAVITYGADSQAREVADGSHRWAFVTDRGGIQRGRTKDGAFERADLGGLHILGDRLFWPVVLDGELVGFIVDGKFEARTFDVHKTQFHAGGSVRALSAYGAGDRLEDVVDYHGGFAQPGSATIRFGKRDYAPDLGAFLSPDAMFLEDPAACVGNPLDCNLYGFAAGNPTRFGDLTGAAPIPDFNKMALPGGGTAPAGPDPFQSFFRMWAGAAAHMVFAEMIVRQNDSSALVPWGTGIKVETKIFTAARTLEVPMSYSAVGYLAYLVSGVPDAMKIDAQTRTISTLELKPQSSFGDGARQQEKYGREIRAHGLNHQAGTPAMFNMPATFSSFFFNFRHQGGGVYTYSFNERFHILEELARAGVFARFAKGVAEMEGLNPVGPSPTPVPVTP